MVYRLLLKISVKRNIAGVVDGVEGVERDVAADGDRSSLQRVWV
jgi:hypothetical protein